VDRSIRLPKRLLEEDKDRVSFYDLDRTHYVALSPKEMARYRANHEAYLRSAVFFYDWIYHRRGAMAALGIRPKVGVLVRG
jgi:hypothetical protein